MLKFSKYNSKIHKLASMLNLNKTEIVSFDLPAGHSCPFADKCLSKADRVTGKITDGESCEFRCYAASSESAFTSVRRARWHNFDLLKSTSDMTSLILDSIPATAKIIRVHSSGDYFNRKYFNAWLKVVEKRQDLKFFGYTKALPYVDIANQTNNFRLVYSYGGKLDKLVTNQPIAYVVENVARGIARGLALACESHPADDYNFIMAKRTFALAIHGTQPAKNK